MSAHQHLSAEDVEELALGRGAAALEREAAGCAECARELAWARAERGLLVRRAAAQPKRDLWAGVEARLSAQPPRALRKPHWARRLAVGFAASASAAAALLLALQQKPQPAALGTPDAAVAQAEESDDTDPKAVAALDRAESDYQRLAGQLEAEYAASRKNLDPALAQQWDSSLSKARTQLGASRALAAQDLNARVRLLDGYAGYLRSLRNVVEQSQEANP